MRFYIAGKYTDTNALRVLQNIRKAIIIGVQIAMKGHIPFIPHLDYSIALEAGELLPLDWYYKYSLSWLEVCDALFLIKEDWRNSTGTVKEVEWAKNHNMKIYTTLEEVPDA